MAYAYVRHPGVPGDNILNDNYTRCIGVQHVPMKQIPGVMKQVSKSQVKNEPLRTILHYYKFLYFGHAGIRRTMPESDTCRKIYEIKYWGKIGLLMTQKP
jgi:hypothetical protein